MNRLMTAMYLIVEHLVDPATPGNDRLAGVVRDLRNEIGELDDRHISLEQEIKESRLAISFDELYGW